MHGYNPNWWSIYKKKAEKEKKEKEYKTPDKCIPCGCKIKEDDFYNGGYDEHKIWLETCDNSRCKQWLKWSVRKRK